MRNKSVIKFLLYLNIIVMGAMITNRILYLHIDDLGDGRYIQNAHPFDRETDPPGQHDHTQEELLALNSLSLMFLFEFVSFDFFVAYISLKQYTGKVIYYSVNTLSKVGRAPPCSLS